MSLTHLSRTLDPTDYAHLVPELAVVDRHGIEGQHEHRRWEYALALHAVRRWTERPLTALRDPLYDVGGAGSTFHEMLGEWTDCQVQVIDPVAPASAALDQWLFDGEHGRPMADVVTCLSVIEHVADVDRFLYHLSCLVAPGGLLVLTMDYWSRCGKDTAHFAHMRERIFCPKSYQALVTRLGAHDLLPFGGIDLTYHGAQVYDYTFASLVVEKRR